jgi:hypothetical protein
MIQRRMIQHVIRRQAEDVLDMGHDLRCFAVIEGKNPVQNGDFVVPEGFFAFSVELQEGLEFGLFEPAEMMSEKCFRPDFGRSSGLPHVWPSSDPRAQSNSLAIGHAIGAVYKANDELRHDHSFAWNIPSKYITTSTNGAQ